jgi:hypothetical protein
MVEPDFMLPAGHVPSRPLPHLESSHAGWDLTVCFYPRRLSLKSLAY